MPLILCWLEGRTQDEAAGVLGWTPDSVRGRLHRGRALLHARLARRGLALGTGLLVAAALGQKVSGALPAGLARGTVQASLRFAAGGESGVAAGVMALAEGGMRAMRLTGLKVVAVLLGMTLAVSAGGVLARQLGAREEAGPRSRMEESGTAAQTPGGPELAGGAVARVDCFGDPLPAEALVRLGTTRLRHSQHVMAVRFAPDGKMLAAGTDNGIGVPEGPVRLWDVATGTQLRTLAASPHFIRSLAFSPDGKTLAMGDLMGLTLHFLGDAAADKELPGRSKIEKPMGTVSALAFSPDGKTLTVAAGDGIHLMEASTGKVLHTLTGTGPDHSRHVPALAFSPSGRFLASAGYDQTVRLWEVNAGLVSECHQFRGHACPLLTVAFSPDGRRLVSGGSDSTALVWDAIGRGGKQTRAPRLTPEKLSACWQTLANTNAARAYEAMRTLAATDQAVPFLAEHLVVKRPDPRQVARLLADLDSDDFQARSRAAKELKKLGEAAEPTLQQALKDNPSLEVRRRIQQLLDALQPGLVRWLRVVEVLEWIDTPAARDMLEKLAATPPRKEVGREATAALKRLHVLAQP